MCHNDSPIFPVSGGAPVEEVDLFIEVENISSLPVFLATPERTPAPGVLLISDIYGPGEFYRDLARRLAGVGFITALPDLFFRLEPTSDESTRDEVRTRNAQLDQTQALEDIRATLTWLKHHQLGTGKLGTLGFCMGGTLVMLAAGRQPNPDASVAFYGFPKRQRTPLNPVLASDEAEVSGLESPLLAFWGDQDKGVGMDNVEAYREAVTRYHKAHDFIVYPGVGHAFLTFDPEADSYAASQDAWARTLEFLGLHLDRAHYRD